jgi:hypothetical protein
MRKKKIQDKEFKFLRNLAEKSANIYLNVENGGELEIDDEKFLKHAYLMYAAGDKEANE